MLMLKRIDSYTREHPSRTAAVGFLFFVLLSAALSLAFHRSFFPGLLLIYGVSVGLAIGWWQRRAAAALTSWRKLAVVPLVIGGCFVLGLILLSAGLPPR
jgi:hypothetical protein